MNQKVLLKDLDKLQNTRKKENRKLTERGIDKEQIEIPIETKIKTNKGMNENR